MQKSKATQYLDKEKRTEAAVWGPDGDILAHVHSNLGLDWAAIDVAQLFAGVPTGRALIQRALIGGTDDQWFKDARDYLAIPPEAPEESVGIYQLAKRLGDGDIKDGLSNSSSSPVALRLQQPLQATKPERFCKTKNNMEGR